MGRPRAKRVLGNREMRKFHKGDLVRVIMAPDQNKLAFANLIGEVGVVVANVAANSSPNIYKVHLFAKNEIRLFHLFDLEKIN